MIAVREGRKSLLTAETAQEALSLLKQQQSPGALFYPKHDDSGVHVRLKDADGEYRQVKIFEFERA